MLPYTEEDSLLINSGEYNSLGCQEAQQKLAAFRRETQLRKNHGYVSPKGLGSQPPALLGRPHPRPLLSQRRHRARAR